MSSTTADTAVRSQTAAATEGRGDLLSPVLARLKRRRSGAAIVFRGGDRELRQGGRWTIVLAGVATQFGVESAVRQAWELDYQLMVARDATTSIVIEAHDNSMRRIFPRIAPVTERNALAFAA
jgi:nicotinamidase-related amidase